MIYDSGPGESRLTRDGPKSSGRRSLPERWTELVSSVEAAAEARTRDPASPGVELGRFELLDWLGGGGMGVVFRARDSKLGREVAIKLWKLSRQEAEVAVRHEAQCLARLSHPNVVAVYEIGKIGDDVYLTMELVEGMDGRKWISSFFMTWEQALDFCIAAGRGLAAAHAAGLEHGDFKPENILLGRDHRVRVADFGVARVLREHVSIDDPLVADDSSALGTPDYMAPERLQGRRGDPRSDQFSFCVTLWECLYGARPFEGTTPEALLEAMVRRELRVGETLVGVPRRLRQVIARGLSLRAADRWPDIESLLAVLLDIRRRPERTKRRRRVFAAVVGAGLGCSLATAAVLAPHQPSTDKRVAATRTVEDVTDPQADSDSRSNLVGDVLTMIDIGELDAAHERWRMAERDAWKTKTSIEAESLEIARAFLDRAVKLQHAEPEMAIRAAHHASPIVIYSLAYFPADSVAGVQAAEILSHCTRLNSRSNRLLADYSRLSNDAATTVCSCRVGERDVEACIDVRGAVGVGEHACLTDLVQEHEGVLSEYLECSVPALADLDGCVAAGTCDAAAVERCDIEFRTRLTDCPQLEEGLDQRLRACIR